MRIVKTFLALALVAALGGCATTSTTSGSTAAVTTSDVVNYVTPWLEAAANVANTMATGGIVNGATVATAETIANAALNAFKDTPTPATLNTLNTAMVPVYSNVNAAGTAIKAK